MIRLIGLLRTFSFIKALPNKLLLIASLLLWLAGCDEPASNQETLIDDSDECGPPEYFNQSPATYAKWAKQYRLGGVPLKIGSGLITLHQEGRKLPGDKFSKAYLTMKLNPDGTYAYYDSAVNKASYDYKLYRQENEETYRENNWMFVNVRVDCNIDNPSSWTTSAVDVLGDDVVRRLEEQSVVDRGEVYGGLRYYEDDTPDHYIKTDLYVHYFPPGGPYTIETYIYCSRGVDIAHSTCRQHFNFPDTSLVVYLSYRKIYLPYWRFLQDTFIERFTQDFIKYDIGGR